MKTTLYTYLILNLFIGYCVTQNEGGDDSTVAPAAADGDKAGDGGAHNSNEYKRYIVEEDFRNPIFGSYKYDPLKQQFETEGDTETKDGISTLAGTEQSTASTAEGASSAPAAGEETTAPAGSQTPPPAARNLGAENANLRDKLNAMRGAVPGGNLPISHWWARARPLPSDKQPSESTNANAI